MSPASDDCLSFGELADYWSVDISDADADRIEAHVFACARCARLLEDAERLRTAIGAAAQGGLVRALVTDDMLNALARDGVRVRSYTLRPGDSVPCAAWDDDEVLVARLQGDFSGVTAVDVEMRLESGEAFARAADVPVRSGATEILLALPAAVVRDGPTQPLHVTLRSAGASAGRVLGDYVFDHQGNYRR
jgi:hypothetical protein